MEANILTVLAILVAGYTLLSEEKRSDLTLRMSLADKLLLYIACAIAFYVIFIPIFSYFKMEIPLPWLWGFNADLTIFSMILLVLLYLSYKVMGKRLPHSRIKSWNNLSMQLLRQRHYNELSYLLDKYHNQFCSIHDTKWYDKIRQKLPSLYIDNLNAQLSGKPRRISILIRFGIATIDFLLPKNIKIRENSANGLRMLLSSKSFVQYYSLHNPQACMQLTLLPHSVSENFCDYFIQSLMKDTESIFYRELRDTQNISIYNGYFINPANPLIFFYLNDLEVASQQQIWKPIGDYTETFIVKQTGGIKNIYNQPYHWSYEDEERWTCPIYSALHFFDVMVQRAIYTDYADHMYLRYYFHFLKSILGKYQPSINNNDTDIINTRYDYLIDVIFNKCISWLEAAIHKKINLVNKNNQLEPIPVFYSAMILGELLCLLIKTNSVSDAKCISQLNKVIRLSNKLKETGLNQLNSEITKALLIDCEFKNKESYRLRLKKCFTESDSTETYLNSLLCQKIQNYIHNCV